RCRHTRSKRDWSSDVCSSDLVCSEILEVFDTLIPYQYNEQDRRAGYYFGKDRRGQLHRVPLMTLSIGIVTNQHRRFAHPAQVSRSEERRVGKEGRTRCSWWHS